MRRPRPRRGGLRSSTLANRPAAGGTTTTPAPNIVFGAPPIRAVDRPADDVAAWWDDLADGGGQLDKSQVEMCFFSSDSTTTVPDSSGDDCPKPTPAELAQSKAEERAYDDAIRPAPGTAPRTIAELPLEGGGHLELAAWSNAHGKLCFETDAFDADGNGGGGGPLGPCDPESPDCTPLCFDKTPAKTTTAARTTTG